MGWQDSLHSPCSALVTVLGCLCGAGRETVASVLFPRAVSPPHAKDMQTPVDTDLLHPSGKREAKSFQELAFS